MTVSQLPPDPLETDAIRRIRLRLTGAKFELTQSIDESYALDQPTPWLPELERARIAIAAALAWLT